MTIAGADFSCDVRISDSEALCAFVASSTNAASAEANVEVAFEEGSHLGLHWDNVCIWSFLGLSARRDGFVPMDWTFPEAFGAERCVSCLAR